MEVGCFEGLSSFFVLSEYKAVDATLLDIWDMPNPNSKTLSHNFHSIENTFDDNLSRFNFTKIKDDSVVAAGSTGGSKITRRKKKTKKKSRKKIKRNTRKFRY